jgi:NADPH2:quinone reductase
MERSMRALRAVDGALRERDVPVPDPERSELQVRVRAAGLNAADLGRVRRSRGGSEVPLGAEVAGEVAAVGADVAGFSPGDAVMGMCSGGFAEYAILDSGTCLPVPARLSWVEAAGACVCFVTAHDALITAGGLVPGDSVLVNAASSGVGLAALQLARLLGAGITVAMSRSQAKLDRLHDLGIRFDAGATSASGVVDRCVAATDQKGVDIAVDSVGAADWASIFDVMALGGRIVSVGRLGGDAVTVNLDELARRRIALIGVTFRTRSPAEAAVVFRRAAQVLLPALGEGALRVQIDSVYRFSEADQAIDRMTAVEKLGKVVLHG